MAPKIEEQVRFVFEDKSFSNRIKDTIFEVEKVFQKIYSTECPKMCAMYYQ